MDIAFYFYASIGVIIFGIAKGGFAGPASILAVPIMALAMNPAVAAGILLPVLLIMDFIAIYFYWKKWDISLSKIILPPAIVGIIIGGLTFQFINANNIKVLIGTICILFIFLTFAFEISRIFSTKLKKFCPSCFLITLPSKSPKNLTSSLCDLVGIPS